MVTFIFRRIVSAIILVFVISSIAFLMVRLPGRSIAQNIVGESATPEQVAAKATELGLDQPLLQQYLSWLSGAVQGNLGSSWFNNQPVLDSLLTRLPATLSIVVGAIIVSAIVSIALGVTAAVKRGWLDRVLQVVSVLGFALPGFWVGLMLVIIFALTLKLFPATGFAPFASGPAEWLTTITLPIVALSFGAIAATAQQVRGAVIDELNQDYVRTLRSHGLGEGEIIFGHVLRNAAPSALTVLSLQFVGMLGGAIVIEKVFAFPGIGTLAVSSTTSGDVPNVMGVVVMTVLLVVTVNLLIDIANSWLNPKVRLNS